MQLARLGKQGQKRSETRCWRCGAGICCDRADRFSADSLDLECKWLEWTRAS